MTSSSFISKEKFYILIQRYNNVKILNIISALIIKRFVDSMIVLPSGVVTIEGLLGTLLEGLRTTGDPRSENKMDSMQGRQKVNCQRNRNMVSDHWSTKYF